MLRCATLVTLHTGLDATLCYAGDVARGGGVGVGGGMLTFL